MSLFDRLRQYRADRQIAREARDIETQRREQALTARRTGREGDAKAREYEAETARRRKEAAQNRSGGLD